MRGILRSFGVLGLSVSLFAGHALAGHAESPAQPATLIVNGGFEDGLSPWMVCGEAQIVDGQATDSTAMVHSGRYALRLGNPTETDCPLPPPEYSYLGQMDQALFQPVTIPADAAGVTVSFWYAITGDASTEVNVMLAKTLYDFTYNPDGAYLDRLLYGDQPGWHLFRQQLTADELAEVQAQGALNLQFTIEDPLAADENSAFYIDDVQVTLANVATAASPLPAALSGDGTQPLVYACGDPQNSSYSDFICRMDVDGGSAQRIFEGYLSSSDDPTWSPDGGTIALIDDNVYPLGETDPDKYVSATALVLVDPGGGSPRTIYQTSGLPGDPTLVSELTNLTWSPDGSALAASLFDYLRRDNGTLEGGLAYVEQINAESGASSQLLRFATSPSWSSINQLLFELYDLRDESDRTDYSVWNLDLTQAPAAEQPLLPMPALRFDDDFDPTWAPDGERFVTIRTVSGNHYEADGDARYNQALMLFDRQNLANPQMLLLGDHGDIAQPTWSPDGQYIAYTLSRNGERDIWWLDVASGETGPITSDGLSHNADWRPASTEQSLFLPLLQR